MDGSFRNLLMDVYEKIDCRICFANEQFPSLIWARYNCQVQYLRTQISANRYWEWREKLFRTLS